MMFSGMEATTPQSTRLFRLKSQNAECDKKPEFIDTPSNQSNKANSYIKKEIDYQLDSFVENSQ